jgi:cyclopropane fatty-acyl-phospholipid synthase-like methyltransferase
MDTASYMRSLSAANPLRESSLRAAIDTLSLPPGSRGLDAGCGIGLQCLLLAEAVGPTGHITGLDVSTEFLDRGQEIVKEAALSEFRWLCQPDSPGVVLNLSDYDAIITHTLFWGKIAWQR